MDLMADFEAYLTDANNDSWYGHSMTVATLLECEAEAGFNIAVVMPQPKMDPDNEGLLKKTAKNPKILPCVMMDPHWGKKGIEELNRFVELGAKGVKLMGAIHKFKVDDPMVFPLAEAAGELGIVVSIHSGSGDCHPTRIGAVAERIPETPIIMDHMGFPNAFEEGMAVCLKHSNVYLGTTILRFHKRWATCPEESVPVEVKQAVEELGSDRVVFGSNFPEYRPIQVKRAIQRLELGSDAERLVFGGNLARIYGFPE